MAETVKNGVDNPTEDSTIQTGAKEHESANLMNYALFVGGLNVTRDVLKNYEKIQTYPGIR